MEIGAGRDSSICSNGNAMNAMDRLGRVSIRIACTKPAQANRSDSASEMKLHYCEVNGHRAGSKDASGTRHAKA